MARMATNATDAVMPKTSAPDLHLKLVDRVDGGLVVFTDGSRILFPGEGIYFGPAERSKEFDLDWGDLPRPGDHPEYAFERPKTSP